MTLIGLLSDVHAAPAPVNEALSLFAQEGVNEVYCLGDIAGYHDQLHETIALLKENAIPTIIGNHDLQYLEQDDDAAVESDLQYLRQLPKVIDTVREGKHVFMVHAQPPDGCHGGIKIMDKKGKVLPDRVKHWTRILRPYNYDVLVVGHTHQVFVEQMGNTLVINPGSSVFNNCCAILTLPEMTVELFALSGKKIEKDMELGGACYLW